MKNEYIKLITTEAIETKNLMFFYASIASKANISLDGDYTFDCTKIKCHPEVFNKLYNDMMDEYIRTSGCTRDQLAQDVSMLMCMSGPGGDENLPANTIGIEEGFVTFKEDKKLN